jgi:hypothetical protein
MKSKRQVIGIAISLAAAAHAIQCQAATVVCSGTVEQIAYYNPGLIMVRLSSMNNPVFICSTDAPFTEPNAGYATTVQACKVLYAGLLTAKTTNSPIQAMYFDAATVPSTCATWPAWAYAQVRYYVH